MAAIPIVTDTKEAKNNPEYQFIKDIVWGGEGVENPHKYMRQVLIITHV